jgi:hypothetical protein
MMIYARYVLGFGAPLALVVFHCGWWGRHRLTQKIKSQALFNLDQARALNATPEMLKKIQQAYWDML